MSRHPADEARREALLAIVALVLLTPRLVKVYRAAGRARQMDREMRAQHAAELNDLDDHQLERVRDLQAEMEALRADLAAARQAPTA